MKRLELDFIPHSIDLQSRRMIVSNTVVQLFDTDVKFS